MKFIKILKLIKAYLLIVKDPRKTEIVFHLTDQIKDGMPKKLKQALIHWNFENNHLNDKYKVYNHNDRPITLETLKACPKGSIGESYLNFLEKNSLDIDFYPHEAPKDQLDFLRQRAFQSHDLWHSLFDYSSSIPDELSLQAFTFAQLRGPASLLIISAGLIHLMFKDPLTLPQTMRKVSYSFILGEQIPYLLTQNIEGSLNQNKENFVSQLMSSTKTKGTMRSDILLANVSTSQSII